MPLHIPSSCRHWGNRPHDPRKSAFIFYYPVSGRCVCMSNNSFAPILGHGSAIISHNGKLILIWHCLHIPDLHNPLCSLRAHQRQHGCGYIGMYGLGMYVFFLSFNFEVDTATDCHLQYEPISRQTTLGQLDCVQPKFSHTPFCYHCQGPFRPACYHLT